jgi:enhancer of mRNA-decapping protein 4
MKTSVTKTVKECMKESITEIAASISSELQDPVVSSFHQTMREVMVPAYESGTRQMFEQISSSIDAGLELKQRDRDETAKIMDGMVKRMDAMGKTIEVLIKAVAQLQTGASPPVKSLPKTPEPSAADKLEILSRKIVELLRANEFEKAFTHALSVSNSSMALFVCKHSDLSVVVESDTPKLSQPIMLCLMQQLGADLATDENLSIKLAWLQSMALTLDPQNESISKHIRGVVQQLIVNLQAKMTESDPALRRHLQMLLQVIRGIGNS